MKSVIVIPCCKQKLDHPAPAKELYQGNFFKKSRALAERCGCDWFIFSAKYGLIHPTRIIEPYSVVMKIHGFIKNQVSLPEEANKQEVLIHKKRANIILNNYNHRVYLLGKEYYNDLVEGSLPLAGLTTGYRLQRVTNATREELGINNET